MAQFRYKGEPVRSYVVAQGPTSEVRIPTKTGGKIIFTAPDPSGFPIGHIFNLEGADERSLRVMRADSRFEEVL